jgi:hypothetical protein
MTKALLAAVTPIIVFCCHVAAASETWPGDQRDLCFTWPPPTSKVSGRRLFDAVGRAGVDKHGAMKFSGGALRVDGNASRTFCRRARDTGIVFVELLMSLDQPGNPL